MPRYRIQTPGGEELLVEGDHFPTEEELGTISQEMFPKPQRPQLKEGATLADVLKQQDVPIPQSVAEAGGVDPYQILPAIRKVGGEVVPGKPGDTHPDIIEEHGLEANDIDQRGFFDKLNGTFLDRRVAAQSTGLPTGREPANLHSTDLPAYKEMEEGEDITQAPGMPKGFMQAAEPPTIPESILGRKPYERAALGAQAGLTQTAAPGILKAAAVANEFLGLPPVIPGVPVGIGKLKGLKQAMRLKPAEVSKAVAANPLYQAAEETRKYWEKTIPRTEAEKEAFVAQAAEQATGMAGYLVAGPAAPGLIGMESFADHIVNDYEELKKNLGEEEAGKEAMKRALMSGGLQAGVFQFLPKPLRKAGEGLILERFGEKGLSLFLGKRAAGAAQMGSLFGSAHIAENIATGKPPTEGVGPAVVGGILFGVATPHGASRREVAREFERYAKRVVELPEKAIQRKDISDAERLQLQQQVDLRRSREAIAGDLATEGGMKIRFSDELPGGNVAVALPDGTIEVSRREFHNFVDFDLNGKLTLEGIKRMVQQETIHGAARQLTDAGGKPIGDKKAAEFWNSLTPFERWVEGQLYRFPADANDAYKGHEALRRRYERMSKMKPVELLGLSMGQRWNYKSLELMGDALNAIRKHLGTKAMSGQISTLNALDKKLTELKKGAQDAGRIEEAAGLRTPGEPHTGAGAEFLRGAEPFEKSLATAHADLTAAGAPFSPADLLSHAATLHGVDNAAGAGMKQLGDLLQAYSLVQKPGGAINVKGQRDVMAKVRDLLHNRQVAQSVIRLVPIDVMNDLVGSKLTTEELFNNPSVLQNALSKGVDVPIASRFLDSLIHEQKFTLQGELYASKIGKAKKVYGTVQPQPVPRVREVPVKEGRPGVQPQAERRVAETAQVPLEAKAPPAAPAVEGPPAAPVKAPEVAVAKPGTPPVAPAAPAKEPTISKPITEAKVPQVPPEQAELRTLTETLRERDLTAEEQDRLDELIARGVRPAMRARQEDIARETYTRFIGTRNREDHYLWSSPDAGKAIEIIVPEGADAEAVRAKVRERVGMSPAMRAKDPEEYLKSMPERIPGDYLVTLVRQDGSRRVASYNPAKVYDLTEIGQGKLAQVGFPIPDGWSHGMVRQGERIVEDGGRSGAEFELTGSSGPAMRAKPDYEYIGNVYAGAVEYRRSKPGESHDPAGLGRGARWRYDKANNEVVWSDVPTQDQIAAVDNALARLGIDPKRHTSWMNTLTNYREENAPAMRVRDMDDEQLRNYLMPIIAAAGNDPVKRQEAYDRVVAQMDAEEQAEFEQEAVATEMAVPPEIAESLKAIDDKTIPRAMENYLNSSIDPKPMTAKQLKPDYDFPDFRKFSKSVRDMIPGTTEDMLREMWVDKAYDHLLNASGERLSALRAAFKLEGARRYGTRTIPDPPRPMTAEEKNDFVRQVINMDPAEQREFMEERRKAMEAGQKYRRRLITEMITRFAAQALPELRAPVNREGVTPDDIDFEHSKTRLGAYRTFSKGEQDNEGFLQLWLDDFARPSKSARATRTKRLTVVVDRTTGDVNIVSTYGHPTKGKGIMLYDPETDPVFPPTPDKKHRRLGEVMQKFRVKASILLRDPVERFHMRITADPETGRSAEQVYMDLIGEHGEAVESHLDKIWNDFQGERAEEREEEVAAAEEERELRAGRPPKTAAEAASLIAREEAGAPPPSAVERGEGGIFTGKYANTARANAGVLRSNLRYFARGPMTSREVDGLATFVEDMNVVKFSDMRKGLAKLQELAQKVYWTGERRGLRGVEYTALSAIDKVTKSEYFKLRQEPQNKERIDQIKDKEARAKYLEGLKVDALNRALIKIYDLAEKYKTKYEYAGTPHFDLNRTGFSVEILDSYGDRTRRAFESAAAQELAPPESGARTLLLGEQRPGVPRVRGEALMRFPPRERPGPRGMLSPEAERFVREEARREHPYFPTQPGWRPLLTPAAAEGEMARRGKGFVPRQPPMEEVIARQKAAAVAKETGPAMRARTYGISERSREERIASGMGLPMAPNEGLRTEDSIIRGRELIQAGTNPEQIMARFEADPAKRFGSEDVAVVRAHGENLYRKSIVAEDKSGRKSPEFREAFRNLANWETRMRPMLNEWGRSGKAMQGEADVDTGEFVDMARKFRENTGRDFTEEEAEEAEVRVRRTRKAVAEAEEAKERLFERARRPEVEDPQAMSIAEKIVARLDKSAEAALARIRKRRAEGRMYAIPAEDMIDYAIYGAAKMGKLSLIHAKSFSRWSAEMIAEIGDFIRPDLKEIWDESEKIRQKEVEALGEEKAYEPVKKILGRYDEKTTVNRGDTARQLIRPAGPRGKWTPQQAKAIWNYARKMYIDRGEIDFDVVRHNVATDLGMSVKDVTAAMAATKTLKRMTDEMYKRYADRRRIINEARNWLKNQEYPGWKRFARKVPRVFFSAKIFGHGTVGLITHAGNMVFDPYSWKVYFPQWREMYRFVFGSEAYHERAMKDLQLDPLFVLAKRAGLQNDPFKYTDDYQISAITKFFARGLGNRGFDALKTLRQARFNQAWNGLPESLKTPEMAALIADSVNHATGIVKTRFREWANWAFFAPKLEASRWSFMLRDPYVAAETFARWDQMSPERRHMAIMEVKSKASIIGIYAAMLAMNQGFLAAIGSDQEINYTNPLRYDFLAFKVAGFRIGIVSPIIGMIRMFANIIKATYGRETKLSKIETERERAGKEAFQYALGKESPFAAAATTAFFGRDFRGRTVPWSTKKVQPRLRRMGVEPFGWGEYVAETALPIPFEEAAREAGPDIYEAAKEVWQGQGMQQEHIDKIWRGLVIAGSMAATGARVTEDVYRGR